MFTWSQKDSPLDGLSHDMVAYGLPGTGISTLVEPLIKIINIVALLIVPVMMQIHGG